MQTIYKRLIFLFFIFTPWCLQAQEPANEPNEVQASAQQTRIGYLSYSEVIKLMPEFIESQGKLKNLQEKYEAELLRADREFNRKFSEFIEGQKDFPANIMIKRQKELQDLMEKSIAFKNEMKALIEKARKELEAPIIEKMNAAIAQVGKQLKLDFVLNTDNNACPYINQETSLDITSLVKAQLEIP